MYLKIGNRVINATHLVHADVSEGGGEVVLTMTVGEVRLRGDEAERFLMALPTYEPVTGEE